jgi:hypothetical protein
MITNNNIIKKLSSFSLHFTLFNALFYLKLWKYIYLFMRTLLLFLIFYKLKKYQICHIFLFF